MQKATLINIWIQIPNKEADKFKNIRDDIESRFDEIENLFDYYKNSQ